MQKYLHDYFLSEDNGGLLNVNQSINQSINQSKPYISDSKFTNVLCISIDILTYLVISVGLLTVVQMT